MPNLFKFNLLSQAWSSVIAALRFALEVVDLKGALDLVVTTIVCFGYLVNNHI